MFLGSNDATKKEGVTDAKLAGELYPAHLGGQDFGDPFAHLDWSQGPAALQSAALTTEICPHAAERLGTIQDR